VAEKIIEAAKEKDADLIVMATHGRTGLSHALMDSVAEKVVRLSPCPVLTVRPKGEPNFTGGVYHATDHYPSRPIKAEAG
jgi:hypothetical protein